jgi:hypothetical protein
LPSGDVVSGQKTSLVQGLLSFVAFEVFIVSSIIDNVRRENWIWFGFSLFAFALWSGLLGFVLIDAFNRHQARRRRAKNAAAPHPELLPEPEAQPKG